MEIGTLLNLELKESGKQYTYYCKIIEKNDNYLIIDYPIDEKTRKTKILPKRRLFKVKFVGKDQVVYQFTSEIVAKVNLNIPALAIKSPSPDKVERIQRREYVRVETAVDIAIHSTNHQFEPFVTVTSDISGGGLAVLVPKHISLEIGTIVDAWFALQMNDNQFYYIYARSEVVLNREANSRINLISLKFHTITKPNRQLIVRFCFDKQREAKKKELT
ncbi:flagellar brake domain-containing protein [Oceanobacillus profundus]|uniref:flagellar brake protein n=1 Tax=Oceanobacillus TaxID=182709 RepID=UPI000BA743C4|nr:flagellar brake domain-containing protein [Oceanobacillus profundus]MDO6450704.1 flagellar brake domain-containing protein [Oceanobacillus profundus]PAE29843.1 hypothetical protein CHI07_07155 [Paenibacillus sp. 7884-2]